MENSNIKAINQIINWVIVFLIGLTPLFFLPITTNFYGFNKNFLLYFVTGLLFLAWGAKIGLEKRISFRRTPFTGFVFLFALGFLLATIFVSPNKMEPFLYAGETGTIVTLALLYFIIVNNLEKSTHRKILNALIIGAGVLGLIAVYQFLGLNETLFPNLPEWSKDKLWTPAGGSLPLISFLIVGLVLSLTAFLKRFSKSVLASVGFGLATVLTALGLIVTVSQILPGKETTMVILPYRSAWVIAIEAFKQNPLFGVGPGNFISAFNRFRPVAFNQANFWNARFGASSSYLLQLLTVGGILSLVPFVLLTLKIVRSVKKESKNPWYLSLLILLFSLFFLPGNYLAIFSFFVLLAVWTPKTEVPGVSVPKQFSLIPLGLLVIGVAIAFYLGGRAYAADLHFWRSLVAFAENQGIEVYNRQIKALNLNPNHTSYRLAYAQTNFALANSLASQPELTDQDRAQITQLVQQAIREAKLATVLGPRNAETWENLAQLYQNLLNFAQGSDQWAIAAYLQAVATDPINPRIRVNLGGLYYSLQNYDAAVRQFQNAVDLKPDFANGYYNLAAAYREQEKYVEAYNAMQLVLNLIPSNSADYQQAKGELDELAKKLPAEVAAPTQPPTPSEKELTKPEPLPTPVIEPPIKLPEEAGPEIEETPEPEPTPEITPTPQQP